MNNYTGITLIIFGFVIVVTSILTSVDVTIVVVGSLLAAAGLIYEFVNVSKK